MFMHFLKTIFRVAVRARLHSAITVLGLALGLTVCLLAVVTVWQETHYDQHHPAADRLYLVETLTTPPGRQPTLRNLSMGPIAETLPTRVAGIEMATRVWRQWDSYFRADNVSFSTPALFVDPTFLEMFPLEFVEGSKETALVNATSVIISERWAELFFGEEKALGQTISAGKEIDLTVAGVFKDLPETTHFSFQMIAPMHASYKRVQGISLESWEQMLVMTYLRLTPDADPAAISLALKELVNDRIDNLQTDVTSVKWTIATTLMPVKDIHLFGGPYEWPFKPSGDFQQLIGLATIGLLVLVVACFNHVNISTARAMFRAREVAMRKVVGASRRQLIVQFLGEASVFCIAAWLIALVLAENLLKPFAEFLGQTVQPDALWQPGVIAVQVVLFLVVTIASGVYPAFYLSRFRPTGVINANAANISGGRFELRTILVVLQFAISIGLAISAAVIYGQTKYTMNKDLGFVAENLISLPGVRRGPEGTIALTRSLDEAISRKPGVISVSGAGSMPFWDERSEIRIKLGGEAEENMRSFARVVVDIDYFKTYQIDLVAGRFFSEEYAGDRLQWDLKNRDAGVLPVVVNQMAARQLGFSNVADAVNQTVVVETSPGVQRSSLIVGIAKNIHFRSLKSAIEPMVFYSDPTRFNVLTVRMDPNRIEEATKGVEEAWNEVLPGQSFRVRFVDENIRSQYIGEDRQLTIIGILAALAVIIATLGLYGLSSFVIERRIREIGIRKVLGAKVGDIIRLMVWQFSKPVMVANIIAWPAAWYLNGEWLASFAYRIDLTIVPFVLSGGLALAVACLIVGLLAYKTAQANPIKALRTE